MNMLTLQECSCEFHHRCKLSEGSSQTSHVACYCNFILTHAWNPALCRVSAAEAKGMDPQNRLLLEQSALALVDAARSVGSLSDSKTGVYVGCMYQEYIQVH